MNNYYYVYEHWRPDNGTCFYVGFGKGFRSGVMRGRNPHHANIVKKLRRLGLQPEVQKIATGLSRGEAVQKEIELIAYWRSAGVELTNRTDGGDGVHNMPESSRKQIAAALKGNKHSVGVKRTQEQKAAIAARMKGNKIWLGRELTDEHKLNLSIAHKGKHFLNNREKGVICLDDGRHFPSVAMASRNYGVQSTSVSQICGGYRNRKSAGGLHFAFAETA
jgi:hypothetical protein